jgi:formylglycine-generating enzyme required for sulfatase activity
MSTRLRWITMAAALALWASSAQAQGANTPCAVDSVRAGTTCLDKFEASVWRVPNATTTNSALVSKIKIGTATAQDLTAGGATQLGAGGDNYAPCTDNGQSCANDIYAVSLPSVTPSAFITWFQAQEACANAGKRLPTNAEWQVGANGTPDPGPDNGTTDCNSATGSVSLTGARSACVSARGAFDMVGNEDEWVADWVPHSTECPGWASFSNDDMCLAGASTTARGPGSLLRGGSFIISGAGAGPLAVDATGEPSFSGNGIGFRCALPLPEPGRFAQLGVGVAALAALAQARRRLDWVRA